MHPPAGLITLLLAAAASTVLAACARTQPVAAGEEAAKPEEPAPTADATHAPSESIPLMTAAVASDWTVLRVAGEEAGDVQQAGNAYRYRGMLIDTPLPVGYPRPTPPGAIEFKKYPSVRRAEVSGSMHPDIGMNFAFFPLFNHIKRRDIAMTSPVEMDYSGKGPAAGKAPNDWTMSFLYREPSNGELGRDRNVRIVDTLGLTVLATGLRGRYSWEKLQEPLEWLGTWLAEHPEWQRAGDARALYYNGPDRRTADLWGEIQIPVRPSAPTAAPSPES
jgi:hypothetical protein